MVGNVISIICHAVLSLGVTTLAGLIAFAIVEPDKED